MPANLSALPNADTSPPRGGDICPATRTNYPFAASTAASSIREALYAFLFRNHTSDFVRPNFRSPSGD